MYGYLEKMKDYENNVFEYNMNLLEFFFVKKKKINKKVKMNEEIEKK